MNKRPTAALAPLSVEDPIEAAPSDSRHRFFRTLWYACNFLLILSILFLLYSLAWEYSTRRYLKGFSDAIVPEGVAPSEKVAAIINWMTNGPARQRATLGGGSPDRDPTDTLNYASLLEVCGTATNAFVNLSDSAGVPARRLLLLTPQRTVKHVVAEAWVGGRWIVVDPAFRTVFHGPNGDFLTRQELTNPVVFAEATRDMRGYNPAYTFERTSHVRAARLPVLGPLSRRILSALIPNWDDTSFLSLLLERRSLESLMMAFVFVVLLCVVRVGLRMYGERRLGIAAMRLRYQVWRAMNTLVKTAG